jgi:dihydroorotate dehydrogenase (fumarate)
MVDPTTIDLSTRWLGLDLSSPLVLGASPLTDDLDALEAAVRAGAGAVVMRSLFEEQVIVEQLAIHRFIDGHVDVDAEARTFLPAEDLFPVGIEPYLALLGRIKTRLSVPVLASLNGTHDGGWLESARRLAGQGADALELNLYDIVTDLDLTSADVEARQLAIIEHVARAVAIPVSVKLSPFYAALPGFVRRAASAGARGVVLFNRFYQSEIDVDALEVKPTLHLSTSAELPLRLSALAILSGRVDLDLAATGGVHTGTDALAALLAGASVVQMTSAVLHGGPTAFARVTQELRERMAGVGYRDVAEARGAMNLMRCPSPHAWERANYMRVLRGWQAPRPRAGRRSGAT